MMHMMPKGETTITLVHMGHGFSAYVDNFFAGKANDCGAK